MFALPRLSVLRCLRRPGAGVIVRFAGLRALRRQRLALRDLDDYRLRDLGIDRAEAEAEARRPAWDVPAHWRGGPGY